jgi:hypothetical protein
MDAALGSHDALPHQALQPSRYNQCEISGLALLIGDWEQARKFYSLSWFNN